MNTKYIICIIIACALISPAFAVGIKTTITNKPASATYVAYFNGNDNTVLIETSNQKATGYSKSLCRVNADQISTDKSSYDIWAASGNSVGHVNAALGQPDWTRYISTPSVKLDKTLSVPEQFKAQSAISLINLTWNQVDNATGYKLYRRDPSMAIGTYSLITEISTSATTTYSDSQVEAEMVYDYFIVAIGKDEQGTEVRSGHSSIASASPSSAASLSLPTYDKALTIKPIEEIKEEVKVETQPTTVVEQPIIEAPAVVIETPVVVVEPPKPVLESVYIKENGKVIESDTDLTLVGVYNDKHEETLKTINFSVANKQDGVYDIEESYEGLKATATINLNRYAPEVKVLDLENNKAIAPNLNISALVSDSSGIESVKVFIDGAQVKTQNTISAANTVNSHNIEHTVGSPLTPGKHNITIIAKDIYSKETAITITGLQVLGASVTYNYPNPFSPNKGNNTTILYTLDKDTDTKINLYDVTGKLVWTNQYPAGSEGGKAGVNRVAYDGKNIRGNVIPNGVYHYLLINQGQMIGRGQIVILD